MMANLLLTRQCNLNCDYCFSQPQQKKRRVADDFITLAFFQKYLDYLDRSGISQARFLGGEPTLHPRFAELVHLAAQHGKAVTVFSNGLMPSTALQALLDLPSEQCSVLINWSAEQNATRSTIIRQRQMHILRTLGGRALPGFTICRPDFDLQPAINAIQETACRKAIRLGLAHPAPGSRVYLHPKQYPAVGTRLVIFAREAARQGILIEFDCGFVRCMFSNNDLDALHDSGIHPTWNCSPVVDMDANGQAVPCFPLSTEASSEQAFDQTGEELRMGFESKLKLYRVCGVYPECTTCAIRTADNCSAGCLALTLRRMRVPQFDVRFHLTQDAGYIL
jgi:hypothetical protein